ncbi:MAG: MBL fold metallo-hydrolase [Hyphomicrobiaceae bacterium]|nr:MBL fold metallo-hydrolase [Hyphomicrobiaceae bacterium]
MTGGPKDAELVFKRTMTFEYGVPMGMMPGVVRIVAENPGPFTFTGTNTYLVGSTTLAVIDPGPDDARHRAAILAAAGARPITHILITHTHRDHSDGLAALKHATGALSCGFGRAHIEQPEIVVSPTGREFVDPDFDPDVRLVDGEVVTSGDWRLRAVHTPGHAPDHLCFDLEGRGVLFSGDHVMGWNTTVVAPPEGHMGDYMAALERLAAHPAEVYFPGHGGRIDEARRVTRAYLIHRQLREQAILAAIRAGTRTIADIVGLIYRGLDERLITAAGLSVQAHVESLAERGLVSYEPPIDFARPLSAGA